MTWKDLKRKQLAERKKYLVALLKNRNTAEAAKMAGVSRSNFYDLMNRAGLRACGQ